MQYKTPTTLVLENRTGTGNRNTERVCPLKGPHPYWKVKFEDEPLCDRHYINGEFSAYANAR